MSGACDAGSGSARRRRERRLRSWLRHERMTVRMELAAALHHSAFKGAMFETHDAPRSQKTVNSKREAELFSLFEEELGGTRPDRLSDVRPQERVQRHTVEHLTDLVRFWWWNSWPTSSPWWKRRKGKRMDQLEKDSRREVRERRGQGGLATLGQGRWDQEKKDEEEEKKAAENVPATSSWSASSPSSWSWRRPSSSSSTECLAFQLHVETGGLSAHCVGLWRF